MTNFSATAERLAVVIGTRVGAYRAAAGITQNGLANKVGVSTQTINALENGKRIPIVPVLISLAREMGLSVDELVADPTNPADATPAAV